MRLGKNAKENGKQIIMRLHFVSFHFAHACSVAYSNSSNNNIVLRDGGRNVHDTTVEQSNSITNGNSINMRSSKLTLAAISNEIKNFEWQMENELFCDINCLIVLLLLFYICMCSNE